MKINLTPNLDFILDLLVKSDRLPMHILFPDGAEKIIGKRDVYKARITSYPIFNETGLFDVEFKFKPDGHGFFVEDYLIPIGREFRKFYNNLKPGMDAYHLFSNLFVEKFYFDTGTDSFGWELGS